MASLARVPAGRAARGGASLPAGRPSVEVERLHDRDPGGGPGRVDRRRGPAARARAPRRPRSAADGAPSGVPRPPPSWSRTAPAPRPASDPSTTPTMPSTVASTTTMRMTWRRLMPIARRTPISRTRSTTPIVSVLTMPSAATMTATSASASNTPKTRDSASATAPWIRSIGFDSRANVVGRRAKRRRGRPSRDRARSGRRRHRRRARPATRSRPSSRRGSPRRRSRAWTARRSRRLEVDRVAGVDGHGHVVAEVQAEPFGERDRQDRGRRPRRAPRAPPTRSPATAVSRSSMKKSRPTIAAASTRMPR